MSSYGEFSDDFYVYCYLNTQMELPTSRETLLHYFGQFSKAFPSMNSFAQREPKEFALEEDKEAGSYRWVTVEPRRLASGYLNPPAIADCHPQHELMLNICEPEFYLTHLDCEALDVTFGFDFSYKGNHDQLVGDILTSGSPLEGLVRLPSARLLNFEPQITLALDENCRRQARLGVVTRTSPAELRAGTFSEESLSVYLTIRQYWGFGSDLSYRESYRRQVEEGIELLDSLVIPTIVRPLSEAINTREN